MPERNELLNSARKRSTSRRLPGAHMSRQELAEAANAWLAEHSDRPGAMDAHYVAKLERGVVRWPNHDYRAALRATLKAATDSELGFATVDRKTFLKTALGTSAGAWIAHHFPGHDASDLATAIAGPTSHYRRMESAVRTDQLSPAVEAHLRLASSIVSDALPTSAGFAALSETDGLAGWLAADRGDTGAARRHYAAAVAHAERTHNPLLVSYMLASLGQFATDSGDPRQGLTLLQRARAGLPDTAPDSARAWLAALHAVAYASTGEHPATLTELRTADTLSGRNGGEPSWPWVFVFDSAKAARYQASALAELGDLAAAQDAYAAASPALTAPKPRALVQVDYASALARAGHVAEGCQLAAGALAVGRRYRSERVTQRVRAFRASLPSKTREAAALDAALAALYTEATP